MGGTADGHTLQRGRFPEPNAAPIIERVGGIPGVKSTLVRTLCQLEVPPGEKTPDMFAASRALHGRQGHKGISSAYW